MKLLYWHLLSCAVLGPLLAALAGGVRAKGERERLALLFFLLCLLLPAAGPVGILFGIILPMRRARSERFVEFSFASFSKTGPVLPDRRPIRSYGWVLDMLSNSRNPTQKFSAILSCRALKDKESVPILRAALHDDEDDVRLLAYSYLYKKEDAINKRIFERAAEFQKGFDDETVRARRAAELAEDYWELYYLELAQGPVAQYLLNRARGYAEIALATIRDDAAVYFNYGRILLQLRIFGPARQMLGKARELGYPEKAVLSYLAEAAFETRDLRTVRECMSRIKALGALHEREKELAEFWS